jgi:hypothetical protein
MLEQSSFKSEKIKEAEEYFKTVHINRRQEEIFEELTGVLLKYIPISEDALKGIGYQAISAWQIDYKRSLLGIASLSHDERIEELERIFDYVRLQLIPILIKDDYKTLINKAIDKALKFYDEKYKPNHY